MSPTVQPFVVVGFASAKRQLPCTPGHSWALLGTPGRSWALLGTPGRSWPLLAAPGLSWPRRVAPRHFWSLLAAPGCSWPFHGSPGHASALVGTPGHSCRCCFFFFFGGRPSSMYMWSPHDIGRDSWVWGEQEALQIVFPPTRWGKKPSPRGSPCRT